MPATAPAPRTIDITDDQARQLGRHRGYAAASYAGNVSGEDLDTLTREPPSYLDERAAMFWRDGFDSGIDEFKLDDMMLDWPEYLTDQLDAA